MSAAETAMRDQGAAAASEVQGALDALVMDRGYRPGTTDCSPWLAELLAAAIGNGSTTARTCRHVATLRSPQPLFLNPHLRRVVCAPCHSRSALAMRGTAEDTTCDVCRVVPDDHLLTPYAIGVGNVMVTLGTCRDCRDTVTGEDHR